MVLSEVTVVKQEVAQTAVPLVGAEAEALHILHPKLRRGRAIANQNTLTYVLISLRALQRIRAAAAEGQPSRVG